MHKILQIFGFLGALLISPFIQVHAKASEKTAYDFTFESLDGGQLPLSNFRGKVLLIVNTASKCGFTSQYKGLEELYKKYESRGLIVIGVPSNDFGEQEPGSAADIKKFCEINFGVTFPLTTKQVVSGKDAHPFYLWASDTLGFGTAPKWNFHKYLVDRNGKLVDYFHSTTAPDAKSLIDAIEAQLRQ